MRAATVLAIRLLLVLAATALPWPARVLAQAADALVITAVGLDPPTLHMLGVQVLIGGDQNRNARVAVRYRPAGSTAWRDGPPLFRVLPETVTQPVPEQLAGTIFDLAPDTAYQIELHATDPDGPVDEVRLVGGRTRPGARDRLLRQRHPGHVRRHRAGLRRRKPPCRT